MDTTKLTLFSLISKGIALKILTLLFLVCNIQVNFLFFLMLSLSDCYRCAAFFPFFTLQRYKDFN